MVKVFINPGHSKNCNPDPGAIGNGYKEALVAAKIGEALANVLKLHGIESVVYQQFEGDTANKQLNKVPAVANASKADIFISIHLNSYTASSKGTETLYSSTSIKGKKLAELVNSELAKPFPSYTFVNRGVKADVRNLLVLRATSMPAVLTEIGFISNFAEIDFIEHHIADIANRLSNAICQYFGINPSIEQKPIDNCIKSVEIVKDENGLYNCIVDGTLKLKGNKFNTIVQWLEKNYE